MKAYFINFLLILAGGFLLSGCHSAYYFPSQQNIPLFTEKGESKVVGSMALSVGQKMIGSGELNVAHAITEDIFLVGNGAYFSNTDDENGYLADVGAGYYKALSEVTNASWVFEFQGAAGYGKPDMRSYDEFYRFYVQPSIGLRSKNVELAFSTRITALHLNNTNRSSRPFITNNEFEELVLMEYGTHFLTEPSLTLRFGYKNIMFHQQMNFVARITNKPILANPVSFSSGISVRFPFRKHQQTIPE